MDNCSEKELMARQCGTKYPIEMYRDEYIDDFYYVELPFDCHQSDTAEDSHENGMYIKWMFHEIVLFTMDEYYKLRDELFANLNDNNDIFDESCNGKDWEFKFDLGGKIEEYFKNHHNKYKGNIDTGAMNKLLEKYKNFMHNYSMN
jgi:hypothetical protein